MKKIASISLSPEAEGKVEYADTAIAVKINFVFMVCPLFETIYNFI